MKQSILIISPTPTHPTLGGNNARVLQLINILRQLGHDVHFLHIARTSGDTKTMRTIFGKKFHHLPYNIRSALFWSLRRKVARRLGFNAQHVYGVDEWWDESADAEILKLQQTHHFDTVFAEYVFFSKALELFDESVLKVLDTHDRFTNRHELYLNEGAKPQWFSTTEAQETLALNRADVVLAIQDLEAEQFRKQTEVSVNVVGHAVATSPPHNNPSTNRILYVGTKNPINVASVVWFLQEVLPSVRTAIKDVRIDLVGNICEEIPDTSGVHKFGRVDDLRQLYADSDLVINPMQFGTGLKIKSIEALGYAKPLVTTSVGAHGLEEANGDALLIADDAQTFANHVVELLQNDEKRHRASQSAYDYAIQWNNQVMSSLQRCLKQN